MMISRKAFFFVLLLSLTLFLCIFISDARADSGASLFFDAPGKVFNVGEEIKINVKVKSPDQSINAASGSFKVPKNFNLKSIDTTGSIFDFWVVEPKVEDAAVSFQGVSIKKPYQGENGLIFSIKGFFTESETSSFKFEEGTVLADDGLGTNILSSLQSLSFTIKDVVKINITEILDTPKSKTIDKAVAKNIILPQPALVVAPVITSIKPPSDQSQGVSIVGQGSPNAFTKVQFQDITEPSIGMRLVRFFMRNRLLLSDVEVQNDDKGSFSYVSPSNLVAGVYNAMPSYVNSDKTASVPGYSVTLLINGSIFDQALIMIVNSLLLSIPFAILMFTFVFLPWYTVKRLRLMHKKV